MPVYPVPGSEKFSYRPKPAAEVRHLAQDHVQLHDVPADAVQKVDPLTYEVVRHRLAAITEEMGEAIKRMSGSMVVTDANDFNFAIMDEVGEQVQMGMYNMELCASMDMAVKWTLENRASNPGIGPGDMFLCNDPWVGGGLHQNDTSLFAPLFVEGELFAWTCAVAHQVDIGGVSPGSWSVKSKDVFWESLPTPPMKIVEGGILRSDLEDVWLRRSRLPSLVALDLRAKMGANHMAQQRLTELVRKYGADTVKAVMRRMLDDSEHRLRTKLRSLDDGEWTSITYQDSAREGDEGLYRIRLRLIKRGDSLTFDFTGSDAQADGLINCTFAGARGGIMAIMLPMLCGDIPWTPGGIYRCFEIVSESGTINNCDYPAGVSKGSTASAWATQNVATECIAAMMETHPEHRSNATSVCVGTWNLATLSGADQRGGPFVHLVTDPMAGGFGARTDQDGVDTGGLQNIAQGRVPDVEMHEFNVPVLYLWRREEADSGGPGRYRGGLGGSSCFVMHDSPLPALSLVVSSGGKAVPQSSGMSGGYPANTSYDVAIRDSNIRELISQGRIPSSLEDISGADEVMPPHLESRLGVDDVYFMSWQGGGGYGDPLFREPDSVAGDLLAGKVSLNGADEVYGVRLDESGRVDESATERRRAEIRHSRAAGVVEEVTL